eukprot:scaffold3743_cov18-Tisochrysis_lutea.AAC.3
MHDNTHLNSAKQFASMMLNGLSEKVVKLYSLRDAPLAARVVQSMLHKDPPHGIHAIKGELFVLPAAIGDLWMFECIVPQGEACGGDIC